MLSRNSRMIASRRSISLYGRTSACFVFFGLLFFGLFFWGVVLVVLMLLFVVLEKRLTFELLRRHRQLPVNGLAADAVKEGVGAGKGLAPEKSALR